MKTKQLRKDVWTVQQKCAKLYKKAKTAQERNWIKLHAQETSLFLIALAIHKEHQKANPNKGW